MSEWQSIETAPMDGTQVLLLADDYDYPDNLVGAITYLAAAAQGWFEPGPHDRKWYYCASANMGQPTHWAPLPEMPK